MKFHPVCVNRGVDLSLCSVFIRYVSVEVSVTKSFDIFRVLGTFREKQIHAWRIHGEVRKTDRFT